jgi:4-nitrophenyl phosphatase/phosphoglycolate phosphatase
MPWSSSGFFLFTVSTSLAVKFVVRRFQRPKRSKWTKKLNSQNSDRSLLATTDIFIFDCDGVIWKGNTLIGGAAAALKKLRDAGKKVFFMTNNSINCRKDYLQKFHTLGLNWVNEEQVLCSAFAAAIYFQMFPLSSPHKKVFVIGQSGIVDELELAGIPYIGGPSFSDKHVQGIGKAGFCISNILHDEDVEAVLVGFDSAISYYKIQYAQLCLNSNQNCRFIATNADPVKHITADQEWAGSGAIVGAIKGCTLKEPFIVGKPGPIIVEYLCQKFGVDRTKVCMVGDRLDTDVQFGMNNGLRTVLTLSGCTSYAQFMDDENFFGDVIPTFFVNSIRDFFE